MDLSGDVDVMRAETKQRLRDLQAEREAAEAKGDSAALARIRGEVHRAKGKLRRAK